LVLFSEVFHISKSWVFDSQGSFLLLLYLLFMMANNFSHQMSLFQRHILAVPVPSVCPACMRLFKIYLYLPN